MALDNKWTAFWLSLAVPGAGQFGVGSLWCVPWFALAAIVAAMWSVLLTSGFSQAGCVFSMLVVGLGSAEHARRMFDPPPDSCRSTRATSRVRNCSARGRAVGIKIEIETRRDPAELWRLVSDLPKFLTIDPFHQRVSLMRDQPQVGVDLALWHDAFGLRTLRFGRILRWEEGREYAFSDLSSRGSKHGFPHVFFVRLDSRGEATRLRIQVRGKWTSRLVPIWLGRYWLKLVCWEHARLLRKAL